MALLGYVRHILSAFGGALRRRLWKLRFEILTNLIDFGSDLAVLFPFARKGPVFEN